MKNKNGVKFLYHGLVLLLLGVFLYRHRRILVEAGWGIFWPLLPLALGLLLFLEYRYTKEKAWVLTGTFVTGIGGFFLLFTLEYLPWSRLADFWPLLPLLAGLAFFLAYLCDFSGRGFLLSAFLLFAAGLLCLGENLPVVVRGFGLYGQVFLAAAVILLIVLISGKGKPG